MGKIEVRHKIENKKDANIEFASFLSFNEDLDFEKVRGVMAN
jgi:hypothetical protein